jgi:two-component system OmpR family response regulator/two-component system response regulator QseB
VLVRVLLVEDDELLGRGIKTGLESQGFQIDWVRDGEAGLIEVLKSIHQAVVLDLSLPRRDGLEVLAQARAQGVKMPIVVLTAREHVEQKVQGLHVGADDYLVKPIDLIELGARLHAVIRRVYGFSSNQLMACGVSVDPIAKKVMCEGKEIILTAREFELVHALMIAKGRILSREQLEQHLYQWGYEVDSNAIEVHIHHLRKKLKSKLIVTVRGLGYTIRAE